MYMDFFSDWTTPWATIVTSILRTSFFSYSFRRTAQLEENEDNFFEEAY